MKKAGILLSIFVLSLFSIFFNIVPFAFAQEQTEASQSIEGVRESLTGTPGRATQSVTVNFAAIAAEQRLAPISPEESREKVIEQPKRGPHNLPVPPDVISSGTDSDVVQGQTQAMTATSQSPAAASSFPALKDDGTTIIPNTHGAVGHQHLFDGLEAGGDYTVTPSHPWFNFNPPSKTINNLSSDQIASFNGYRKTFKISGRVLAGGSGLAGVTVQLTGSSVLTTTTNHLGGYKFEGLLIGGNYTVTLSKAGYKFTPASSTFTNLSRNQTANFSATRQYFSIGGKVYLGGEGFAGVTVRLTGSQALTTTTNHLGGYKFANLPAGGNYAVTPVKTGYTFNPARTSFNSLNQNHLTTNFTATQP